MAEKITITSQIPSELHARATEHARKTSRSVSGLVRWALMSYLNSEEAQRDIAETSANGGKPHAKAD